MQNWHPAKPFVNETIAQVNTEGHAREEETSGWISWTICVYLNLFLSLSYTECNWSSLSSFLTYVQWNSQFYNNML